MDEKVRAIRISGAWPLTDEELMEKVDSALHDAGLCACENQKHFYTMSITPVPSWGDVESWVEPPEEA